MNSNVNPAVANKTIHFEMAVNSMEDGTVRSISKGDVLAAVKLPKRQWISKFKKGGVFIIFDRSLGLIVREVINYSAEANEITCHSWNHNEKQPDFNLKIDSIIMIYYIDTISHRYC